MSAARMFAGRVAAPGPRNLAPNALWLGAVQELPIFRETRKRHIDLTGTLRARPVSPSLLVSFAWKAVL